MSLVVPPFFFSLQCIVGSQTYKKSSEVKMFSFADLWVRYMQNHCFADLCDCQFYARRSMRPLKMIFSDWGWINGVFLNKAKFYRLYFGRNSVITNYRALDLLQRNSCHY